MKVRALTYSQLHKPAFNISGFRLLKKTTVETEVELE
jgi:hypothetical protein